MYSHDLSSFNMEFNSLWSHTFLNYVIWFTSVEDFDGSCGNRHNTNSSFFLKKKSDSEQTLRKKYPQFAQQHNNVYMQQVPSNHVWLRVRLCTVICLMNVHLLYKLQDAEECWTQLVYTLSQTLTSDAR